jgi:hypothetical protein
MRKQNRAALVPPYFTGMVYFSMGAPLYVFCHCPFEVHSPFICLELYRRVQALVPVPSLPWQSEQDDSKPEQARLF